MRPNMARWAVALLCLPIVLMACETATPTNSPTSPAATGAAPTGAAPTGAAPTGAAPTGAAPTGAAPTGAAPSEDLKLVTPGTLTLGYASNPDSIECTGNECTGRLAFLIERVAERLGLQPVYEQYAFAALVPALQSHRIDVLVAGFSVTQARSQVLYQGPPQYMGLDTLITRKGDRISTYEEAAERGLILASVRGYLQIGNWEQLGIQTHTWDNTDACVADVLQGGAFGCAVGSLYYGLQTVRDPDGRVVQELEQNEIRGPLVTADLSSSFTVAKDRPELARALAQQVRTLWRDGSAQEGWEVMGLDPEHFQIYMEIPETNYYIPGPWEEGVVPPASETFPSASTIEPGVLTVGVVGDSDMLRVSGDQGDGPEAEIIGFVAGKLGLTPRYVSAPDETGLGETVDILAGQLPTTRERTGRYWMTQPIGFNPDYMYVAPDETGALPVWTSWEEVVAADGTVGVVAGSDRAAHVEQAGIEAQEYPDAATGLKAVADDEIQAFVTSTVEYAKALSADPSIQSLGFNRNRNLYTYGEAFAWGVNAGDAALIDALDQGITMAWQQKVIATAYGTAWPGADVTALQAPGPSAIGTSFGASKDYQAQGMLISGPWLQYQGYVPGT
jgi:ABC-type amino acid transport substrate-binding protein